MLGLVVFALPLPEPYYRGQQEFLLGLADAGLCRRTPPSGRMILVSALERRIALVTGGGRGIGRAIALALADAGARVAVLARSRPEVERVAADVNGVAVVADVARPEEVRRAVAAAVDALGPVELLVNNAGVVGPLGRLLDTDPDEWERSVAINLFGSVRCVRAVLPGMLEAGWGRIVNITSGAASPPGMPSGGAYSAGKAGLEVWGANLAAELAGTGVTVNNVRPGTADTGMQEYMRSVPRERVGAAFHDRFTTLHREKRLVDPALAGRLVVRLAETGRTGETLDVRSGEGRALVAEGGSDAR